LKITIDPEGAEYTDYDLMSLAVSIQKAWESLGRGMIEVYSMNFNNAINTDNKQNQEIQMLKAKTGDI
jgi:hypothetical protein